MKARTNYEVVKKLTGSIYPVGEAHTDDDRFENLKEMAWLIERLLQDIHVVSESANRHEHSMKRAGEFAKDFLKEIGVKEEK